MSKYTVIHVEGVTQFEGQDPRVVFTTDPQYIADVLTSNPATWFILHKEPAFTVPTEAWLDSSQVPSWLEDYTDAGLWVAFQSAPCGGFYMITEGE